MGERLSEEQLRAMTVLHLDCDMGDGDGPCEDCLEKRAVIATALSLYAELAGRRAVDQHSSDLDELSKQ